MLRRIVAYLAAVAVVAVLGAVSHSLFVQHAWSVAAGMGEGTDPVPIPIADRLSWILHDVVGMQPLFATLAAVALLIAFLAGGLLHRFVPLRTIIYAGAGGVAMWVLFTMLKWQLGTVGVFGARGMWGLAAQVAVGILAGLVFAWLSRPREA